MLARDEDVASSDFLDLSNIARTENPINASPIRANDDGSGVETRGSERITLL
jgi:hypothetical protein